MAKDMSQQDSLELKRLIRPFKGLISDGLAGSLAQGPRETRKGRTRAGELGNKSYFLEASNGP